MHKNDILLVSTLGLSLFLIGIPLIAGFLLLVAPRNLGRLDRCGPIKSRRAD